MSEEKFIPANDTDNSTSAKVIEEQEGNISLTENQMKILPKGFYSNPTWSKHSKWNAQTSKFIGRNKYNESKAITAKQKRELAKLTNEKEQETN